MVKITIKFDRFDLAMNTHEKLFGVLRSGKSLTCKDLYNILDDKQKEIYKGLNGKAYEGFGWKNLSNCTVMQNPDDTSTLILPRVIKLEGEK